MFGQTLAIVRNTFFESIRQPIMLVVLLVASIAIILSNPLSAFTMENDQRMLLDIGLATIFLCGTLLAAFIATNVLGREIHNKTALTVISKPVGRPLFLLGKYLGVAAAITVGVLFMSLVFVLVVQHGVLQTVRQPYNVPVIVFGISAAALGIFAGAWCNYFYNMVFSSTTIVITTPLLAIAYLLCLNFRFDFSPQPISTDFQLSLWLALGGMLVAVLVLSAVAIAASTRCGQVMTLVITLGIFIAGMLSDHYIGRQVRALEDDWLDRARVRELTTPETRTILIELENGETDVMERERDVATVPLTDMASGTERVQYGLLRASYAIVPNFQVLWLSDALTQGHRIPPSYVVRTGIYGAVHIVLALGVGIVLFQNREVG